MERNSYNGDFSPFHPTPEGCVARDPRLAAALEEGYPEELGAVTAYTYRAILLMGCDAVTASLFERLSLDEMRHFRILGELILALGGNPTVSARLCVPPIDPRAVGSGGASRVRAAVLADAIREERCAIDRYQTLMGRTQDRVVRSVLSQLVADEHRHVEALFRAQKENQRGKTL